MSRLLKRNYVCAKPSHNIYLYRNVNAPALTLLHPRDTLPRARAATRRDCPRLKNPNETGRRDTRSSASVHMRNEPSEDSDRREVMPSYYAISYSRCTLIEESKYGRLLGANVRLPIWVGPRTDMMVLLSGKGRSRVSASRVQCVAALTLQTSIDAFWKLGNTRKEEWGKGKNVMRSTARSSSCVEDGKVEASNDGRKEMR